MENTKTKDVISKATGKIINIMAYRFNPEYHEEITEAETVENNKTEEGENKIVCENCEKEFKNSSGLKNHQKTCIKK